MPGGNLSADSVASTDPGGRYCTPLSLFARRKSPIGRGTKAINPGGVWGQSPRKLRRPPKLPSEARALSHNALILLAPEVGLDPTTLRLTAECSAIELLRSDRRQIILIQS